MFTRPKLSRCKNSVTLGHDFYRLSLRQKSLTDNEKTRMSEVAPDLRHSIFTMHYIYSIMIVIFTFYFRLFYQYFRDVTHSRADDLELQFNIVTSHACGDIIRGETGDLASPKYPDKYPNNQVI